MGHLSLHKVFNITKEKSEPEISVELVWQICKNERDEGQRKRNSSKPVIPPLTPSGI